MARDIEQRCAKFNPTSFATGRFRRAYKGHWTLPKSQEGRVCVVKENKSSYIWKATEWDETLEINKRAKELAAEFNTEVHTNKPVLFTEVHVMKVVEKSDPQKTPKLNEYVTCEDYIYGQYTKFCNNYGYIGPESSSLPALMHWSWWHTKGEEMLSDLQGVRNSDSYMLTDPAMLSLCGKYGATDTSVEGIAMFFLSHKCNCLCSNLPKPTEKKVTEIVPQYLLEQAKRLLHQIGSSTTYKVELKFPKDTRDKLGAKFRVIAKEPTQ